MDSRSELSIEFEEPVRAITLASRGDLPRCSNWSARVDRLKKDTRYDFTIHTYGCKVTLRHRSFTERLNRRARFGRAMFARPHLRLSCRFRPMRKALLPNVSRIDRTLKTRAHFGLGSRNPASNFKIRARVTARRPRSGSRRSSIESKDPFSTVVITGCGAQVDGRLLTCCGRGSCRCKLAQRFLEDLLDQHFRGELTERVFRSNIFVKKSGAGGGIEAGHTRAF